MTAPPVQYTDPGSPGYCPPYARYDKVTGALVPSDVPVNSEKSKSAVPTNPNTFIAKAATYVRTEVAVPKEAVPTNSLVQISSVGPVPVPKAAPHSPVPLSSVGPVPLAVAADSPGAAGTPAPENGDQILLYFSPLTTVTTLEYQGLATLFQSSSDPKHQQFSSPATSLTSSTPSPRWSSSSWCRRALRPSSPLRQTSSASGASRHILYLNLPLRCPCLRCTTTAHSMEKLIAPRRHIRPLWTSRARPRLQPPISSPDARSRLLRAAAIARAVQDALRYIRAISTFRSSSRRGRPPDRSRSEEGRPTRTSIPARLAVRRGDRATA